MGVSMNIRIKFALIILLAIVAGTLAYPKEGQILKLIGIKHSNLYVREGLDLQGGAQLVFQADLSKAGTSKTTALNSVIDIMERRANNIVGAGESTVQLQGNNRVSVELPGVKDVNSAISELGATAQLQFLQSTSTASTSLETTDMTSSDVKEANADINTQTGQPIVDLQLKSGDATKRFGDLTTQLNQSGGYLTILLDTTVVFGPATVSSPITNGVAQLQGNFTNAAAAQQVAQEINDGALPVPVTLVEQQSVGPSLGKESVSRSLVAGGIGLLVVALFMVSYYRLAGLLAVAALIIYTAMTLAIYKLSVFVPGFGIVLSLGGIAGFIISIGMAVDANILIFERFKEELRAGRQFPVAAEAAFQRAWTSIRDSNTSTLITCVILYNFGTPIIQGFALTLGLGVVISLFTAVVITRTFLRLVIRAPWGRQPRWYGLKVEEAKS
jgi:preprotein translocase subunit SecD